MSSELSLPLQLFLCKFPFPSSFQFHFPFPVFPVAQQLAAIVWVRHHQQMVKVDETLIQRVEWGTRWVMMFSLTSYSLHFTPLCEFYHSLYVCTIRTVNSSQYATFHHWKLIKCISNFAFLHMAVASGPAGPVLAGSVFTAIFETAHARIMNNKQHVWGPSYNLSSTCTRICHTHFLQQAIAGSRTSPRPQQQAVSPIQRYRMISQKRHISK